MASKWDTDDLAYAAAFLDGEGCFSVGKNWKISVRCSNSYRPVVEWLKTMFGGSITRVRGRKKNHRMQHSWGVVSNDAANLCRTLAVYLKEKAEQALLLIAIQQTMSKGGRGSVSQEIKDERSRLAARCTELKHVAWA